MPTLSKLVAALIFGATGYMVSGMVDVGLSSDVRRPPVFFAPIDAALGALVGWRLCGARSGAGYGAALGIGLTGAVCLAALALLGWAFTMTMERALRLAYDGPLEAVRAGIAIAIEFGTIMVAQPASLLVLAVGGIIGGLASEPFAERAPRP